MVNGRVYIQHHMKQATQFSAFPDKGAGLHVAEQKSLVLSTQLIMKLYHRKEIYPKAVLST